MEKTKLNLQQNSYRNLFEPIHEQNEFDAKIQEYEQGEEF